MAEQTANRPPEWLFKRVINPTMRFILRSPLHGLLSDGLALLTFTGRKSGKQFSTPVAYNRLDDKTIMVMTRSGWWKNFSQGEAITVLVKGKKYQGKPEIILDKEAVWGYIMRFLQEHHNPRKVGIMNAPETDTAAMRKEASDLLAIRITLS